MNNMLSYYGLVDAKIRASDKDLPVYNIKEKIGNYLIIYFLGPVLPQAMRLHSMVAVPDLDSVITVGGLIDSETAIDDLYELTCQPDDCVWNKKEQTLKNARYNMVATIVPDELITCQERKLPK